MKESQVGTSKKNEQMEQREEVIEKEGNAISESSQQRQDAPVGILRLDGSTKSRRSTSELRLLLLGEPSSPQPSVDRLSVTFAEDSTKSDSSTRVNLFNPDVPPQTMDKVHFPTVTDGEDSEEDYSASANVIIQRKASLRRSRRRSKRRTSSPYSPDMLLATQSFRRASVYTTSSGDTAISIDDAPGLELTQEQIFENIRLHKEVLTNVKMQPWNMRKKLKLVMQAKNYVKRHEGALQERFTQTHSIRNMIARWNIYLIKKWQHYRREMANISNWLIPWERRIKEIESHFGSVVASYFTFLRWIFWVNVVISVVLMAFVVMPEIIIASRESDPVRKQILPEEKYNSTNFLTIWDFEGVLRYTPVFYGWYTNKDFETGYRLPLAYFITQLAVYVYSFVATLKKMATNSRMSKLSEKGDESVFTWKLFTGWDYMIGNSETAQNRTMSIVMGFKEALLEEAEKKRKARNWKVIWSRVFVNIVVLVLFALSAAAVVEVVRRSTEPEATSNIWRRNETTVVMTLISFIFPMILEFLGFMEQYHPRKQLRVQLARIMLLNLLNLYSLIFAQFDKITDMTIELLKFKPNVTSISVDPTTPNYIDIPVLPNGVVDVVEPQINCHTVCHDIIKGDVVTLASTIASLTTTIATNAFTKLYDTVNITATIPSTALTEYITSFYNTTETNFANTSESYDNATRCCDDATEFNMNTDDNLESLLNTFMMGFQDYLSYVLGRVSKPNMTNTTETYSNVTDDFNLTASWEESSTYTALKSTMATILNTTPTEISKNYENQFTTFYDEVTSTISEVVENCEEVCEPIISSSTEAYSYSATTTSNYVEIFDYQTKAKLRSLCWETMFGQELVKLTIMDFVFTVIGTVGIDFLRGVFVRVMNRCWCWDLEKAFPEYGEFKVAENILHLVNNQGMVWMGMFFSPGLVAINVGKLILLMYLRSWAVLTCNVPHAVVFRASRSNNFYFALLLIMLFLCVLPVGFAIVWVEPSWNCGPFSYYSRIYHILTKTIRRLVPRELHKALEYVVSPGIVIPLLVILVLIIYYLISLTNSLREANSDLKIQLRQERTEERRKMFQMADRRRRTGSGGSGGLDNTPFAKWKKLIHGLPSAKSTDDSLQKITESTPTGNEVEKAEVHKARDIVVRFLRRAMHKQSINHNGNVEDVRTDNEHPESLPEGITKKSHLQKTDSIDSKRVQITSDQQHIEENTCTDFSRREQWRQNYRNDSPSRSNSSKDTRQDSICSSNWSDNIPIITISKTESAENILAHKGEKNDNKVNDGVIVKHTNDDLIDEIPQRVKHILAKQSEVSPDDDSEDGLLSDDSTKTTVKSFNLDKSSGSGSSDVINND